jgi:hypothetical protein
MPTTAAVPTATTATLSESRCAGTEEEAYTQGREENETMFHFLPPTG